MSVAKVVSMIIFCMITGGVLYFTLTWFFRRIRKIEEENWGPRKQKDKEADTPPETES